MQLQTLPTLAAPTPSLPRRLTRVIRPGRTAARVEAAASLPLWVAGPIIVLSIYLLAEAIAINAGAVDSLPNRLDIWNELRLEVLDLILSDRLSFLVALFVLGLLLLALEVLNLLVFAPLSVPMGEKLRSRLGPCRKVVYSLGGLWAVQAAIVWTLINLFVVPWWYWSVIAPADLGFVNRILIVLLCCAVFPLALLLGWVMWVMRACSHLAQQFDEPPLQLCAGCGYLLKGLAAGAGCPECGLTDPAGPDRARQPTAWSRSRGIGRLGALIRTIMEVAIAPTRFFRRMQVLEQANQSRRVLCWTIWLSMPLSALALPGVMASWSPNRVDWGDCYMFGVSTGIISLLSALIIVVVLGLLIALVGLAISRARQEPAWPIAAAAGAYLAGLVPWIAAGQALWLWPFFAADAHNRMVWYTCVAIAQSLQLSPDIPYVALLLLPAVAGLLLAIRTAVVCYRQVRYACR
jgi:hypothetical protein